MMQFCQKIESSIENKIIIIMGTQKDAHLLKELLGFMGKGVTAFLDIQMKSDISTFDNIPVLKLKEVEKFESDSLFLSAVGLPNKIVEELEIKGCQADNILDMREYARGKVPESLFDTALQKIRTMGGSWEHCKYLFEKGIGTLEGNVGKCFFLDKLLILEGWLLPRCCYDNLEVFLNGILVGNVELGKRRPDIKKAYPVYNEENAGFYLETFISSNNNNLIEVKAYYKNLIVWEKECEPQKIEIGSFVMELLKQNAYERLLYIIKKYISIDENSRKIKEVLDTFLTKTDDVYIRINIYQLLYQLGFFNSSYMEKYMGEIDKIDDVWTKLWLLEQDISWMLFYYPQYAAQTIYQWKRSAMRQIVKKLQNERKVKSLEKEGEKNVAILVEGLADEKAASSIFELEIANKLAKRGYNVTIYVLDSSWFEKDIVTNTIAKRKRNSYVNREYHFSVIENGVDIWYSEGQSLQEKVWGTIDKLTQDCPLFIIDISLGGMVTSAMFEGEIPILHIPLTGYSSGAIFDAYIAKSKRLCEQENQLFHSIEENKISEVPINIPYNYKQRKIYYREEQGLEKDSFVMVTVGNRLKYEMDITFLQMVQRLLETDKKYKWIVVGNDLGKTFYYEMSEWIENGQIKLWGIEDDLVALYKICDVFLNPNRVGGCGSMELAMQTRLPVAITTFPSDIMPIIGEKHCCGSSYEDMITYIEKLRKNFLFSKKESRKFNMLLKKKNLTMEYYVDVLERAYKKAR